MGWFSVPYDTAFHMWILNSSTSKTIKSRRYIIWCLPNFYLCALTKHLCPPKDENIALTSVLCALTLLHFVTIHCANVRLITWNSDLFAWRISIWKYIRVIIHCTFWSPLKNLPACIFLLLASTKETTFRPADVWPVVFMSL